MSFINQLITQLSDLFRSMTPGARITSAGLLALIVISLGYLVNHQVTGPDAYLLDGESFTSGLLSEMEAAWGKAGLSGFEVVGGQVRVPRGDQAKYIAAAWDNGVVMPGFGKHLEKANAKSNLWMTSKSQQADSNRLAMQQEVAEVVRNMTGVEDAGVIFSTKDKGGLSRDTISTATVSVKMRGGRVMSEDNVPNLRNLVVHAFAGLKNEEVAVVDLNSGRTYQGSSNGMGSALDDPIASRKKFYDNYYEERIRKLLAYVPGVIVGVGTDIDTETVHEESKIKYGEAPIAVESSETKTERPVFSPSNSGQPGFVSQQPGGINSRSTAGSDTTAAPPSNEKTSLKKSLSKVDEEQTRVTKAPLPVLNVRASIGIPSSYVEEQWLKYQPAAALSASAKPNQSQLEATFAGIKAALKESVDRVLPEVRVASKNPFDRIDVAMIELPRALPDLPPIPMQEKALAWLGSNWTTLGMGGFALMSLLMLRGLVRDGSGPAPTPSSATAEAGGSTPAAPALNVVSAEDEAPAEPDSRRNRLKRRGAVGPSLRDELTELVNEDPSAAVSVLKAWIGNVS
jgi:flagellar M-ring protein FliF